MWNQRDRATSIVLAIVAICLLMLMLRIGISIKNISTDASSNSWRASKEVIHAILTPLGRFDVFVGRSEGLDDPGGDAVLVLEKSEAELKFDFFWKLRGLISKLSISQLNQKKVNPMGMPLSLSDLDLTVFPDSLRNATACIWLMSKTQHQNLCMTLVTSYWAVNVLMEDSRAMRGMILATECNFRRLYMVDMSWLNPVYPTTQCRSRVVFLIGRWECGISWSELSGVSFWSWTAGLMLCWNCAIRRYKWRRQRLQSGC